MRPHRLDLRRIRAITLDLDDTLWPVWPTIARAEDALRAWLHTRGFAGIGDGLALIAGLLDTFWPTLHPELDPVDEDSP
ncbi:MAG TPA: type VI secretion system ImpA family N-terminal domain-containing protein, partial [Ottowia sp.]|nr:type VI secretion system ImpA family N-terminal domain-containing protein [Ottowia sp.]